MEKKKKKKSISSQFVWFKSYLPVHLPYLPALIPHKQSLPEGPFWLGGDILQKLSKLVMQEAWKGRDGISSHRYFQNRESASPTCPRFVFNGIWWIGSCVIGSDADLFVTIQYGDA